MDTRTTSALSGVATAILLSGCSVANSGPLAAVARYCLAMPDGGGQGWSNLDVPVSDLLDPSEKPGSKVSWETLSQSGYIYRVSRAGPLTHKVVEVSFQFADAGVQQSKDCGPRRLGVARMVADGAELTGWDLINTIPNLIAPAVQARAAQTSTAGGTQAAATPRRKYGEPAAPIVMPVTHYGELPEPSDGPTSPGGGQSEPPQMGNCHMGECSWSRTLSRVIQPTSAGSVHHLTLLGGTSKGGDANPQHVVWNRAPHDLTITCSRTHPSVSSGGDTDDLQLNAAGSQVPDVEMDSFTLYATECHPEAKDLDPDALAKRFNYYARMDQ